MKTAFTTVLEGLASSGPLGNSVHLPKRSLGCSIFVIAIEDYLSLDDQTHTSAARFLFPTTDEYREHYDWVVSMATGMNQKWLRDALDRARSRWDQRRMEGKLEQKLTRHLQKRLTA